MTTNRVTPRGFLAKELQRAREAKGISRDELAQEVFVSESLVRAWESGRRIPQPDHLKKVEKILGTNGILCRLREDLVRNEPLPEYMGRWREIEEEATSILWHHPLIFPGLAQTPEYAREIFVSSGRQMDDIEEQIQERMERQKILAPENGLMFIMIIDEGVLYRRIGSEKIMADQITGILELSELQNVRVQIVPLGSGAYAGLAGGFGIAAMDGQEYAYVDDAYSGDVLEHSDEVAAMKRVWMTIHAEALPTKQSKELMVKALEKWTK